MTETMPPEGTPESGGMMPPEAPAASPAMSETAPPMPPQPPVAHPMPGMPPVAPAVMRPKTDVGFFIIGVVTSLALFVASGFSVTLPGFLSVAVLALPVVGFVVFLILFLRGKKSGNIRLWSWAKGAMWGYVSLALLALLLFGTCLFGGIQAPA